MKQQIKLPYLSTRLFITIIVACLIFVLVLWYDSSPVSYNSYNTICTSNYGKISEYNDCMKPYFNQLNMDHLGIMGAAIVALISTKIFIFQRLKKIK